jgi:anti-anti-sigma regulatory factor
MRNRVRGWLYDIPLRDPIERQQAALVQVMLVGILIIAILVLPICYYASDNPLGKLFTISADTIVLVFTPSALLLFRRGHFHTAVSVSAASILLGLALFLVPLGTRGSWIMIAFAVPITLTGLLGRRRDFFLSVGASAAIVAGIALLERLAPSLVGFAPAQANVPLLTVSAFVLIVALLALFLDRFGRALRGALGDALAREQDLERLRESLSATVTERTADVQAALQVIRARADEQAQLLAEVEQQRTTIRALSIPVLPISASTLVIPLVGVLDAERLQTLREQALRALQRTGARYLMLDTTGVPVVDSEVAQGIIAVVQAARLLGAEVVLVGIRPEVAQALASLTLNMQGMRAFGDLQSALDRYQGDRARLQPANGHHTNKMP